MYEIRLHDVAGLRVDHFFWSKVEVSANGVFDRIVLVVVIALQIGLEILFVQEVVVYGIVDLIVDFLGVVRDAIPVGMDQSYNTSEGVRGLAPSTGTRLDATSVDRKYQEIQSHRTHGAP